ncbi:MAG: pentapeptide repeat-containing protein [Pseudanabaenales cyanobacterium]|nr:pentapeptide repeat-containing protein [Pseudanabaenales cyanobacterium]
MSRDALIVGINSYKHLSPLKAPALDAEAIAQRLEQDGEFQKVIRLPEAVQEADGKKPVVSKIHTVSQIQLKQALKQLFLPDSLQAPETALFYFSGHGIADREGFDKGYLATSDTHPDNPSAGISLRWLQWLLSKSAVKRQIIWLDCCHSGGLLVDVGAANPGHSESRDRCFIASSRDFESSWEDLNSPYSVLTKALLEGLDPTRLPGRWIDTFALVDYVNQVLKGELQTPVCTHFGEAINLTKTWRVQDQPTHEDPIDQGICPYKGLEFFDCNDEDPKYFFGREQLIGKLLDHVRTSNFMALVGASGNGKSSVLRAGLLHQLKLERRIAGSDQWRIRLTRPDRQPMQNLALSFVDEGLSDLDRAEALGRASGLLNEGALGLQRLVQASSAPRVILVIDQFEEVFTRCESIEEREQFFACLMGALAETRDKLCLIIAMRADFVGKCLERQYSGLAQQIQQHMISVMPMESNELKAAICNPAEQVGLTIESALVTEILNDIAGAPGSLPLLQYTLKALWQQRQGTQLVLAAYQTLGGIAGALDKRATEIYNSFEPNQQQTVQHIFQQLTQLGEGTEDTRRRVFQSDLIAEPKHPTAQVQQVIERLSNPENRLIVTSEVVSKADESSRMAIVDVAHEALIRHWRLLRQWIEQNRDSLRQQRKIEASGVAWREQGRQSGYLLQGLPLIEATQFEKHQADTFPLSDPAKAFIKQSIRQRRWNRLKTARLLIIMMLLSVGVIEPYFREASVKDDFDRIINGASKAAEDLVQGCDAQKNMEWLASYLAERLFGNCRPLNGHLLNGVDLRAADLSNADLSNTNLGKAYLRSANLRFAILRAANLSNTDLSKADLSGADFSDANLSGADLSKADLSKAFVRDDDLSKSYRNPVDLIVVIFSNANLSNADLSGTDLRAVDLSGAIILNTDLRTTKALTQNQLEGDKPPFICNSPLPEDFEIGINRDCDTLANVLRNRYPLRFKSIAQAQEFISEQRQKKWD